MIEKEEAAPVGQTGSGGGDQLMMEEVFSASKFTKNMRKTQGISALLMRGEANAIPLHDLKRISGLDGRIIRRMIQDERQNGTCICVNNKDGYFLAETEAERARCVVSMRHRAAEVNRTANAIERAEVLDDG
jgi:hypothetical protein